MTTTLHYVHEAVNNAAQLVFVVFLNLDTAELKASVLIYMDRNVIKKEH
jgi:hypothetical protein